MMKNVFLVAMLGLISASASARTFKDHTGRTVEADLVGVRGENVVLSVDGDLVQWPITKLSEADQAFVKEWQKNPPPAPDINVRVWEREGIGPSGTFDEQDAESGGFKNIPGWLETEEKEKYKYYDVDLTNRSRELDANHVVMSYVLYVIDEAGNVIELPGTEQVKLIAAGKRVTAHTRGATYLRTKKTQTTLHIINWAVFTGKEINRSKQSFGGAWVKVYSAEGKLIGESKDLHPEVAKLKPAWTGSKNGEEAIPAPEGFDLMQKIGEEIRRKIEEGNPQGVPVRPRRK